MYLLGISPEYTASYSASREQYKTLEDTPQETIREVEATSFKEFIGNVATEARSTLVLSHLVFALHLDKETSYLTDRDAPEWYLDSGDAFMQLVAPSQEVLRRRIGDESSRERTTAGILEIETHQKLCDEKWQSLTSYVGTSAICSIVNNVDLMAASKEVEGIIYG